METLYYNTKQLQVSTTSEAWRLRVAALPGLRCGLAEIGQTNWTLGGREKVSQPGHIVASRLAQSRHDLGRRRTALGLTRSMSGSGSEARGAELSAFGGWSLSRSRR